jgi:hypothetical protein
MNNAVNYITISNLFNSVGMFIGSSVGAYLLTSNPDRSAYHLVFLISTFARMAPLILLPGMMQRSAKVRDVFFRIVAVRPTGFPITKPLWFSPPKIKLRSKEKTP